MCDRKNMKICLPDNLSLLDSSYFKSHGIWVLEKDQRQMWIFYTRLDRNLSLAIATSTLTVSWRHSVVVPMVSCLPFSYIFSPPAPSLPNSPLRFLPVPSCAPSELPLSAPVHSRTQNCSSSPISLSSMLTSGSCALYSSWHQLKRFNGLGDQWLILPLTFSCPSL